MQTSTITKLDAARRQLVTAIRLFFNRGDPISVFSLAANAWEVIDALCTRKGIAGVSHLTRSHIPPERDLKKDYVNSPYRNFFKHADHDPEALLEGFDGKVVDGLIFLAADDYMRLAGKSPVEFQVFQLWYLAVNVEKVAAGELRKILEAVEVKFSKIRTLQREEQIVLGKSVLDNALLDNGLLKDPKTEAS